MREEIPLQSGRSDLSALPDAELCEAILTGPQCTFIACRCRPDLTATVPRPGLCPGGGPLPGTRVPAFHRSRGVSGRRCLGRGGGEEPPASHPDPVRRLWRRLASLWPAGAQPLSRKSGREAAMPEVGFCVLMTAAAMPGTPQKTSSRPGSCARRSRKPSPPVAPRRA